MPRCDWARQSPESSITVHMNVAGRYKLMASGIIFALVFCLTVRPVLNAADPESSSKANNSLAERLFGYASDLARALHERPSDERNANDYHRALYDYDLSSHIMSVGDWQKNLIIDRYMEVEVST